MNLSTAVFIISVLVLKISCMYCEDGIGNVTFGYLQAKNVIVRAYIGSVARLPCQLCFGPIDSTQVVWMYSEPVENSTFNAMEEKETAVIDGDLTLYYTRSEDAGAYQCRMGRSYGGVVLLEVTDTENYNVVKPLSSRGPYPSPPERIGDRLIMFTHWSEWSECTTCGTVGRRRRYGICYIALIDYTYFEISSETAKPNRTINEVKLIGLDEKMLRQFHVYPQGIPCRSQFFPLSLRNLPELQSRNNEIMIGLCKVPCKNGTFELWSDSGELLERVNITAGIYSLCQHAPPQPPPVARQTVFALPGYNIHICCPGTTLRDVPVTWRVGNKRVSPRQLDATTQGRIHLNARDHIVFSGVQCNDAGVYSCWQDDILAGVIKLEVSQSAEQTYRRRITLVVIIMVLLLLLRYIRRFPVYRLHSK